MSIEWVGYLWRKYCKSRTDQYLEYTPYNSYRMNEYFEEK